MANKYSLKGVAKCIFCDSPDLSGEHIWPAWAGKILGTKGYRGKRTKFLQVGDRESGLQSYESFDQPGHAAATKIRAVCRACNSGWMSQIENGTKAIVAPLMAGGRFEDLSQTEQRLLAVWIALRVLVFDYDIPKAAIYTKEHLATFKDSRAIPECMHIWIGRCTDPSLRSILFRRTVNFSLLGDYELTSTYQNAQSTSMCAGELFFFSMGCVAKGVGLEKFFDRPKGLVRIWPDPEQMLVWPPMRILEKEDVTTVSQFLIDLSNSEHVKYIGRGHVGRNEGLE